MGRIVNIFGAPGSGKSITAAALFAELKYVGHRAELVMEYAKDAVYEGRGPKFFAAQSHIYGEQSFRIDRVIDDVEFIVTDSPLLMSSCYVSDAQPALIEAIYEHHRMYETLNILLYPTQDYERSGRYQTPEQAGEMQQTITQLLIDRDVKHYTLPMDRRAPTEILAIMEQLQWI